MRDKKKKIHITTLGCEKNLVDSEALAGYLMNDQYSICESPEDSEIIIINTCGFIKAAKEESIDAILQAGELKKSGKVKKIIVAGCMSAKYSKDMIQSLPEVDAFFGAEDYENIAGYLGLTHAESIEKIYSKRNLSGPRHYAYLKISEGCDHLCSFCSIPQMRGKHRSRTLENILAEARMLAENGAKELILIAQDSTYWGKDIYKKRSITKLLGELEKIDAIKWIRVMYLYPNSIPADYFDHMRESEKLLHYVDIPLQHASTKMLKIMGRGGNSAYLYKLIEQMRNKVEDIVLRTTFIVGHPGEEEKDFEELIKFIKNIQFNRVGAFQYSAEEDTISASMSGIVADQVMQQRYNTLMEIQQNISLKHNRKLIDKKLEIFIDQNDPDSRVLSGRTYGDAPEIDNEVIIENYKKDVSPGSFIKVKIVDAHPYELIGTY